VGAEVSSVGAVVVIGGGRGDAPPSGLPASVGPVVGP